MAITKIPNSGFATPFNSSKIINDISSLALREASNENRVAYNSNSSSVDVFQDGTGIDTTSQAERNTAEYVGTETSSNAYETGDRTSIYTVTNTFSRSLQSGHNINKWIDGSIGTNSSTAWKFSDAENMGGNCIFDLGSGNSKIYTGVKIIEDTASGVSAGNFSVQLSNTGNNDDFNSNKATITDTSGNAISANEFTWGPSTGNGTTEVLIVNNTDAAHRYIRIKAESSRGTVDKWQQEIQFKVKSFTYNASGNFTGTTITAPSSVSSMGGIITYQDNQGTNALNTDIILQLSADGGSNFTTATLEALPDFSTGIKMAKANDVSVTAGTSLKYKILFANQSSGSKEARIRGVSLQY
tara:strand:- start:43 stop:1110 length:1068 start_codon:yes stop_codon:yes gene_type:complete